MQRYFIKDKYKDIITINKEDSHHIKNVMRMNIGDIVELVIDNKLYLGEIINLEDNVLVNITKHCDVEETSFNVTIAQALVSETKMDYLLQKTTELGVNEIIPLKVERSVVDFSKKEDKKIARWNKIVKEASEQSKRLSIPKINNIINIKDLIKLNYDIKVLCSVNEVSTSIKKVLEDVKSSDKILFVVGPEGGFTKDEEQMLIGNGFISTTFGKRVLRSETTGIFLMSIINYIFME